MLAGWTPKQVDEIPVRLLFRMYKMLEKRNVSPSPGQ